MPTRSGAVGLGSAGLSFAFVLICFVLCCFVLLFVSSVRPSVRLGRFRLISVCVCVFVRACVCACACVCLRAALSENAPPPSLLERVRAKELAAKQYRPLRE